MCLFPWNDAVPQAGIVIIEPQNGRKETNWIKKKSEEKAVVQRMDQK